MEVTNYYDVRREKTVLLSVNVLLLCYNWRLERKMSKFVIIVKYYQVVYSKLIIDDISEKANAK